MVAHAEMEEQEPTQSVGNALFNLHSDGTGIDIQGWVIRSVQNSIAASSVEEALSHELGIKLPGMLFDKSSLQVSHRCSARDDTEADVPPLPDFELTFSAVDALKMVGEADPNIKVKAAERWDSKSERSDVEITTIEKASDWTFSTRYPGTVTVFGNGYDELTSAWIPKPKDAAAAADDAENATALVGIDYDALRNTDLPILFSSQVILFEDELDDNGAASYKVRIRVMPSFFFILARFFLRVDGVLIRIYDTRYFHRFGSNLVVREIVTREADLASSLKDVHPSLLRDPDLASQQIAISVAELENIPLVP